jgi:hypothetical protein
VKGQTRRRTLARAQGAKDRFGYFADGDIERAGPLAHDWVEIAHRSADHERQNRRAKIAPDERMVAGSARSAPGVPKPRSDVLCP